MLKRFKKAAYIFFISTAIITLTSCNFVIENRIPIESLVPQTTETIELIKPEGQDGTIKPSFYGNEPDEEPYRPLENKEVIRGVAVRYEPVKTEDELIAAAQRVRKPLFYVNSSLRPLYNKVLMVLNTIIQNDMSDYERVLAIYDYISYYTVYDFELLKQYEQDKYSVSNSNPSFSIKGVLNNSKAVCQGFANIFSLMCSIEGIENVIITGEAGENSLPHAWNKVKLDGKWYAVDSTNASYAMSYETGVVEYHTRAYFLVSDDDLKDMGFKEISVIPSNPNYNLENVKATENYGFYQKEYINGYTVSVGSPPVEMPKNYVFNSKAELKAYLDFLNENNITVAEFYSTMSKQNISECLSSKITIFNNKYNIYGNVYFIVYEKKLVLNDFL